MPLYDYGCPACSHEWEGFQKVADKDKERCPKCTSPAVSFITIKSTPGFLEGWDHDIQAYVTGPHHRQQVMKSKGLTEISKAESHRLGQWLPKKPKKSIRSLAEKKIGELYA